MPGELRQSTAATVPWGPFVDDTDFKTAKTALTIQKASVRLKKNGGDLAAASSDQGTSDAGAPHDELGAYDGSVNTTDTNTLGRLDVFIKISGALVWWDHFDVITAQVWDSKYSTDLLQVDAREFAGVTAVSGAIPAVAAGANGGLPTGNASGQVAVASFAANAITTAAINDGALTAAKIAADAITAAKIADGAIDAATFAAGAINAAAIAADAITAAKIADGAIDAATFAAGAINAAAIAADAITDAKVASDVTIASVTGSVGSVTGAVGSVTGAVGSVTGAVGSISAGGISAASFAAGAIDAAAIAANAIGASELAADAASEIAAAVRTELATELARVDAAVTTRATPAQVATELGTYDAPTNAEMVARTLAAASYATAATQATQDTKLDNIYGKVDTEIQSIIDALALLNADTDDIQSRLPAALVGGRMNSNVDAIKNDAAAASAHSAMAKCGGYGTVDNTAFTATTTIFESSDLSGIPPDTGSLIGRTVVFYDGSVILEAGTISAYSVVTARAHITISALTRAPANGQKFAVV